MGRLLRSAEETRAGYEEKERSARADAAATERALDDLETRRRRLAAQEPEWREHDARAERLRTHLGAAVVDRAGLDSARSTLAEQLAGARKNGGIHTRRAGAARAGGA